MRFDRLMLLPLLMVCCFGCGSDESRDADENGAEADSSNSESLGKWSVLSQGVPKNSDLVDEAKADQVFPAQFDLVATQSPVKDQGGRSVCSIFSTVALMEHLYIKEGTIKNPDFSEQYLQWAVKNQFKKYTDTEASNAEINLKTIAFYGIPEENAWTYESSRWNKSRNSECSGSGHDHEPIICYSNGEPPESAKNAKLWKLPYNTRYVNSKAQNIKAYMYGTERAAIASVQFFYQSWNHGSSNLKINADSKGKGYVLYPNEEDFDYSLEHDAGHSVLLVGWDDNLEVPIVDKAGKRIIGEDGKPVTEKGFFLFKNSWGSRGSFGAQNPKGRGYGWISYRYVEDFGSIAVAAEPEVKLDPEICDDKIDNNGDHLIDCDDPMCADDKYCTTDPEICDDGIDNDGDGLKDCADSDCFGTFHCASDAAVKRFTSNERIAIPDNDSDGITSTIEAEGNGKIGSLRVHVEIDHPYRRDLEVVLMSPEGEFAVVFDHDARNEANLDVTVELSEFDGASYAGEWTLIVADTAAGETGTLKNWSLEIVEQGAR